jgi:aspartate ammonia-lyase
MEPFEVDIEDDPDSIQSYGFEKGELNFQYDSKRFGELNPMYGVKHSEETRKKIKKNRTEQVFPDNFSETMSKAVKKSWAEGRKPGYGKVGMHSEEGKKRISKALSERIKSEETIEKFKQSRIGKGTGERNAMSNPELRAKVAASKLGRKKFLIDGEYKMLKVNPPDIEV